MFFDIMFTLIKKGYYMNICELNIIKELFENSYTNQRILSKNTKYSLGVVNKSLKNLFEYEFISKNNSLTLKAKSEIEKNRPKNAIILAAGLGFRMVPINFETPKAMVEVKGEILIERIIRQLREVGVEKIYVLTGYMKEKFEYLIDKFNVELVYNREYFEKNNIFSLKLVADKLDNSYIVPSDIWCKDNPFSKVEMYSWYMVSDNLSKKSEVRVNRKNELVRVGFDDAGNDMLGISYLLSKDCDYVREKIKNLCKYEKNNSLFWEKSLFSNKKMIVHSKLVNSKDAVEINTYEQLRELDNNSNNLDTKQIKIISNTLSIDSSKIKNISVLKKGMTNRSFLFEVDRQKYIMRVPGNGTKELINRKEELDVYSKIKEKGISDDIIYINAENGYKITKYIDNARCCDKDNKDDLKRCMKFLKIFHDMNLKVEHTFDIFKSIDFYETLRNGQKSVYKDYDSTKEKVKLLKNYIENSEKRFCLCHIDANCDNFLFDKNDKIYLIDWEYSAMQDPHLDIAMFCIYSLYDKKQIDDLIDIYFENNCKTEDRIKIYAYISACGLLWSNWCEYKFQLGIEFGEYSVKQYHYAKEYFNIVNSYGVL